ncbi:hypothetical protein BCF33_0533 [Hasllibacter halocynthiae]|uniref:Protease inhibitor Inh n=1 Tax=Hasllibacter halocynthiae TaxID=595589 RepID=A0A2T0X7K8_9RHOB|nr:hypothetical protein [Hasllibacter halocynthiae]PRY94930.1 hypothetical protein BCF33_0533 [Hasllibacter halocynthiae]
MTRAPALLLVLLAALPAAAQQSLTPDEFLDRLAPGSAIFAYPGDGDFIGAEEFLSRERSIYAHHDGTCAVGFLSVEGPQLCFDYPDLAPGQTRHCWWPFEDGGALFVRSVDDPSHVQEVTPSDVPVACEGRPTA